MSVPLNKCSVQRIWAIAYERLIKYANWNQQSRLSCKSINDRNARVRYSAVSQMDTLGGQVYQPL